MNHSLKQVEIINLSKQYALYLVDQKMLFSWMTSVLNKLYITKWKESERKRK